MSNLSRLSPLAHLTCVALSALPVSIALGQTCSIYLYEVDKNVSYTQTSNALPVDPDAWYFHAGLFYGEPDAVTAASLTFERPPTTTMELSAAGPMTNQGYSSFYETRAELDADFPATIYQMRADCAGGSHVASVTMPVDPLCRDPPLHRHDLRPPAGVRRVG